MNCWHGGEFHLAPCKQECGHKKPSLAQAGVPLRTVIREASEGNGCFQSDTNYSFVFSHHRSRRSRQAGCVRAVPVHFPVHGACNVVGWKGMETQQDPVQSSVEITACCSAKCGLVVHLDGYTC